MNVRAVIDMREFRKLVLKASATFDRTLEILLFFAGILLGFATLSVALGIVTRYFFARPMGWVTEISEYILLYSAFLVGAWVLRSEGHVKMDIVLNMLPPKAQSLINFITSLISCMVCLIITWYGAVVTWDLFKSKAFTYTILELPKFIFTFVICLGGLLLFIQFIRRAYGYLKPPKEPRTL